MLTTSVIFSSRRRHTRLQGDWSSDVCSSDLNLRRFAWIEGNRRKVSDLTGGRVGYVYLPNTAGAGYSNFNRYYFAQVGKEAVIVDERFNEGGQLADWVVDFLHRPLMGKIMTREGADWSSP